MHTKQWSASPNEKPMLIDPIPVRQRKWKWNMHVERHAPSTPVLVVTTVLAVIALVCFKVAPFTPSAFVFALLAVIAMLFGTLVKT